MKYSLDCYIRTNNSGLRNAVKQLIPIISDPRIWDGEYDYIEIPDEEGVIVFQCLVRFNVESERNAVTASVKGLAGIINACELGSFVREHKCYHDENPSRSCEEQTILRKE